jgi:hypothetical protein
LKLNPFVYAFSNRAIRRAFRQVIFPRFCCCGLRFWLCRHFCPNKSDEYNDQLSGQYQRGHSNSFQTQISQVAPRRTSSFSAELIQPISKTTDSFEALSSSPKTPIRTTGSGGPIVSFADFLVEANDDEILSNNNKQLNQDFPSTIINQKISS